MAQRAYRHRKETTISSLEKRVQELKGANEEMSNIFINLHDFAIAKGILQREPEFGQQLQSTTERFLALAKATQDDISHDEDCEDRAKLDGGDTGRLSQARRSSPRKSKEAVLAVSEPVAAWGGYTVNEDNSPGDGLDLSFSQSHGNKRPEDFQIVTRPTEDNASFPFDLMDLQTYRVEVPQIDNFSDSYFPPLQPPLPNSYNYNEFSFARRIHRLATERAFRLFTSENPKLIARRQQVFGLCLLYESEEAIKSRLTRLMAKSTKETLQDWRAPFVHIGGAGTYYPMHNSEVNGELMPKFRTGYSMGPFSPSAARVEGLMEEDMRCSLPGFEGEFFDPNDVEGYLRGRGFDIHPAAEFVSGELDLAELAEAPSPLSITSDSVSSITSPRTPRSPVNSILLDAGRDVMPSNFDLPRFEPEPPKAQNRLPFPLGNFNSWNNGNPENFDMMDPIFDGLSGQKSSLATPNVRAAGRHQIQKQTVTLDVNILMDGESNCGL